MSFLDILDILLKITIMKKRTTRTYTIDDKIYEDFERIIKQKSLNRSRLIESMIVEYIKKNSEDVKN